MYLCGFRRMGTKLTAGAEGNPNIHQIDTPELFLLRHCTFSKQSFQLGILQEQMALLVRHNSSLSCNSKLAPL